MSALALGPAAPAVASGAASTGAATAIPYRAAAPVSAGTVTAALAITALALAGLTACIAYARRRGWVTGMHAGRRTARGPGIEVRASRRVSAITTVHIVAYGGLEYLLVETGRGCAATVAPLGTPPFGQGDAT